VDGFFVWKVDSGERRGNSLVLHHVGGKAFLILVSKSPKLRSTVGKSKEKKGEE